MKLSVSLFSCDADSLEGLYEKAAEFEAAGAHLLHLDYPKANHALLPLDKIKVLKTHTNLPIDVHLIVNDLKPSVLECLNENQVYMCSVQFEDLEDPQELVLGKHFRGHFGISVMTDTPIEQISRYAKYASYISLMATTPGKSGGSFDARTFDRINEVKRQLPRLKIQVDGGVNYEVGRALRAARIDYVVSGSFVVNSPKYLDTIGSIGLGEKPENVVARNVMFPKNTIPMVTPETSFQNVIRAVSKGKMGAVIVVDELNHLLGIITDGDIRRAFEKHQENVIHLSAAQTLNPHPFVCHPRESLNSLFSRIDSLGGSVLVIPVCDEQKEIVGAIDLHGTFGGF